jgi:hypothetical protein
MKLLTVMAMESSIPLVVREMYFSLDGTCAELNVMEMRPPRMDDSGRSKYPVLFRV